MHCHPFRAPRHVSLHPISSSFVPSSQVSVPTLSPSPHISLHMVDVVFEPPEQFQPGRLKLRLLVSAHPFPSSKPSSQVSSPTTSPSQGISVHIDFMFVPTPVGVGTQSQPSKFPLLQPGLHLQPSTSGI